MKSFPFLKKKQMQLNMFFGWTWQRNYYCKTKLFKYHTENDQLYMHTDFNFSKRQKYTLFTEVKIWSPNTGPVHVVLIYLFLILNPHYISIMILITRKITSLKEMIQQDWNTKLYWISLPPSSFIIIVITHSQTL